MLLPPLILALATAAAAASPTLVLRPDLPTPAFTKTVAAVCGLAQCDARSADDVAQLTGAVRAGRYAAVVVQVIWRESFARVGGLHTARQQAASVQGGSRA